MKLNYLTKALSSLGRWLSIALLCLSAFAFGWQGFLSADHTAFAAGIGDSVKEKVSEDTGRTKGFIRDTADKVERTASKNAERVDRSTDGGNFVERKARRDAARIHQRAEQDAARTERAVDNTKNAVKGTVENIKKTFSDKD